jgi:hypothetical protein
MLLSAKTYGNTFCLLGVDALTGEKTGILKCPKMLEYIRVLHENILHVHTKFCEK